MVSFKKSKRLRQETTKEVAAKIDQSKKEVGKSRKKTFLEMEEENKRLDEWSERKILTERDGRDW